MSNDETERCAAAQKSPFHFMPMKYIDDNLFHWQRHYTFFLFLYFDLNDNAMHTNI